MSRLRIYMLVLGGVCCVAWVGYRFLTQDTIPSAETVMPTVTGPIEARPAMTATTGVAGITTSFTTTATTPAPNPKSQNSGIRTMIGHQLKKTDDLLAFLVAVEASQQAQLYEGAANVEAQCFASKFVAPSFKTEKERKEQIDAIAALNGLEKLDPRVAEAQLQAVRDLQEACLEVNKKEWQIQSLARNQPVGALHKRLMAAHLQRRTATDLWQIQLEVLQSPNLNPEAFELWLFVDLWRLPSRPDPVTNFEKAFVEDALYRRFVPEVADSLRTLYRCANTFKCRPDLVVPPARQTQLLQFADHIESAIRRQQWHLLR